MAKSKKLDAGDVARSARCCRRPRELFWAHVRRGLLRRDVPKAVAGARRASKRPTRARRPPTSSRRRRAGSRTSPASPTRGCVGVLRGDRDADVFAGRAPHQRRPAPVARWRCDRRRLADVGARVGGVVELGTTAACSSQAARRRRAATAALRERQLAARGQHADRRPD